MWGVFTRYDDLEMVLDRVAAVEVVTLAIEWARRLVPPSEKR